MPRTFAAGQRLDVPQTANTILKARATFSFMCWFKAPSSATTREMYTEDDTTANQVFIRLNNTGKADAACFNGGFIEITSTASFDDNVWHRLFYVRRADADFELFIDEVSVGTNLGSAGTAATIGRGNTIGNWSQAAITATDGNDEPFTGSLFRMVALTEAITAGEAKRILYTGRTQRNRIFHYELQGAYPEPSVFGISGGIGQGQALTASSDPGVTTGMPPGVQLPDALGPEKGWIDWLAGAYVPVAVPDGLQIGRPVADVAVGTWTTETGSASNLYQSIDEPSTPNDADYDQSVLAASSNEVKVRLNALSVPSSNFGCILRFRYQKNLVLGKRQDLTVKLYRADGTTVVKSQTLNDISDGPITGSIQLTTTEAGTIPTPDYATGLVLGFTANQP